MRTQIRIVAGSLRGRKVTCDVNPALRPTPQRAREALFSILGNAVPGRAFFDVFAGTGVVGMEALSRGASSAAFVERDFRLIDDLEKHLRSFKLSTGRILRADVYRWVERWLAPAEPVNVFVSPPFPDLENRAADMLALLALFQEKIHPGSVLILQAELAPLLAQLPDRPAWDERIYGRNHLLFWVKNEPGQTGTTGEAGEPAANEDRPTDEEGVSETYQPDAPAQGTLHQPDAPAEGAH